MKSQRTKYLSGVFAAALLLATSVGAYAADVASTATAPVTMTVTANVAANKRMPQINRNDVVVQQGKSQLEITGWTPARGSNAGLELFLLIDDSIDSSFSLQYDDLRGFIRDQAPTTSIGVGYMRNGTIQVAQDLTTDRRLAAQALRLPLGSPGAYGSPYLSLVDLMKRWPVDNNRREVLMVTSGIGRDRHSLGFRHGYRTDTDADAAIAVAQRTGTNVFSIYAPSSLRYAHGSWAALNGQMNMSRLSDATGGASFYLGLHGPVTIAPYLSELQTRLDNQYLLSFAAKGGKKAGLQPVKLSTEVAGVDLAAHDAVWVSGAK